MDKTPHIWDAATGASLAELKGHTAEVSYASFNPDGSLVVTCSDDQTARIWRVTTGASVAELKGHVDRVVYATFSPTGARIVTASADNTARIWDVSTGECIAVLGDMVCAFASFSPDGARLVTGSEGDSARVWDATTGASLAELVEHKNYVCSASFSPDGSRIVTVSNDNTARIWDSVPYRERFPSILRARECTAKMAPVVQARLSAGESVNQIRRSMTGDPSLTLEERTAAFAELQRVADLDLEKTLSQCSRIWTIVRFPGVELTQLGRALADARDLIRIAPDNGYCLNILGVTLYRAGEFKQAFDTLCRSDALNSKMKAGPQPADRAFLAMTLWKLGRTDEARVALKALRELASEFRWEDDEETQTWLNEAETLILTTP